MEAKTNDFIISLLRDNLELREEIARLNKIVIEKQESATLFFNKWQEVITSSKIDNNTDNE